MLIMLTVENKVLLRYGFTYILISWGQASGLAALWPPANQNRGNGRGLMTANQIQLR